MIEPIENTAEGEHFDEPGELGEGSLVVHTKRYLVTIENAAESLEVPVFATSLENAHEQAEWKYAPVGYEITRVRPDRFQL